MPMTNGNVPMKMDELGLKFRVSDSNSLGSSHWILQFFFLFQLEVIVPLKFTIMNFQVGKNLNLSHLLS